MRMELCVGAGIRSREFKLISHRGGKGFGPENTLRSLAAALDFGVEMIETDVRMSADGVPVIQHSPFIGLRLLSRMGLEEIRERAPDIPTLRDYLELGGDRCEMNLEVKKCDAAALAATIEAAGPRCDVLVSSFDADFLDEFNALGTGIELGLVSQYELLVERLFKEAERCGAATLLPVSYAVKDALVETAHAAGFRVITWTVNSTEQLRDMVAAGVDGVITDSYPDLVSFLEAGLSERGAESPTTPQGVPGGR